MLNSYNRTYKVWNLHGAARLFKSVIVSFKKAPVNFHQGFAFCFWYKEVTTVHPIYEVNSVWKGLFSPMFWQATVFLHMAQSVGAIFERF